MEFKNKGHLKQPFALQFTFILFLVLIGLVHILVFTNLWVSLSAAILCAGFCHFSGIENGLPNALFVFCATLFIYNFQRVLKELEPKQKSSYRIDWIRKQSSLIKGIALVSFVTCIILYFFFLFSWESFLTLALLGIISILYAYKFIRGKNEKLNLRDLAGIKIHLIALVWVGAIFVLPMINTPELLLKYWPLILAFFIYVIAVTIPFDIRDLHLDHPRQKTIAQLFGEQGAKITSLALYTVFLGIWMWFDPFIVTNLLFWVIAGIHIAFLLSAKNSRPELFFSFGIDGIILLYGILFYTL